MQDQSLSCKIPMSKKTRCFMLFTLTIRLRESWTLAVSMETSEVNYNDKHCKWIISDLSS